MSVRTVTLQEMEVRMGLDNDAVLEIEQECLEEEAKKKYNNW